MNDKERYVLNKLNNVVCYINGQISIDELETFNSNEINFFNERTIAKVVYMHDVFKDKFALQIMNNYKSNEPLENAISLRDTVTFNKDKIKSIANGIISYVFNIIDSDFDLIKNMVNKDEWTLIIYNSFLYGHLTLMDMYYCNITIHKCSYIENYCKSKSIITNSEFLEKIKTMVKTIIKKYESIL